ncbi:MAG TPA: tetraacyldisaccharide 4'-kinase [bacterium]|nr:tetraacyldisaccharide 4'-kinase [bacterium]HQL61455.1 tetraacyldisaccharide 4'-kinase [bacterium]
MSWIGSWTAYARGESTGFFCMSPFLKLASIGFHKIAAFRQKAYEGGWLPSEQMPVPVISVGNVTVGGTGKTPCVSWLAKYLIEAGKSPAVILRGYGNRISGHRVVQPGRAGGEEALLLCEKIPQALIVEAPHRRLGARAAIMQHGSNVIILDDGFQHMAIRRNLDLALVDATCPWGNGAILPAGILREPRERLGRADAVILTRADLVDTDTLAKLSREIQRFAPEAIRAMASHFPFAIRNVTDQCLHGVQWLAGRRVGLCSAIGNPKGFAATVNGLGATVLGHTIFRDHHRYSQQDIKELKIRFCDAEVILCTAKDAVKLRALLTGEPERKFWALEIEWRFLSGEEEIRRLIAEKVGIKK